MCARYEITKKCEAMENFPAKSIERYILGVLLPCAPDQVVNDALLYTPNNSAAQRVMFRALKKMLQDAPHLGGVPALLVSILHCILPCYERAHVVQLCDFYGIRWASGAITRELIWLIDTLDSVDKEQCTHVAFGKYGQQLYGQLLRTHRSYCEWAYREHDGLEPRMLRLVHFLEQVKAIEALIGAKAA